jgi:hypothetical protein
MNEIALTLMLELLGNASRLKPLETACDFGYHSIQFDSLPPEGKRTRTGMHVYVDWST